MRARDGQAGAARWNRRAAGPPAPMGLMARKAMVAAGQANKHANEHAYEHAPHEGNPIQNVKSVCVFVFFIQMNLFFFKEIPNEHANEHALANHWETN